MTDTLKEKYPREYMAAVSCLIFGAAAHLYRWMNLMLNHDSLRVYQTDGNWQISIGRFFVPFYLRLRGLITPPFLIGMLGMLYLSASVILVVRLLGLRRRGSVILCAGLMVTSEAVSYLNASYINYFDIQMLALLAGIMAVTLISSEGRITPRLFLASTACTVLMFGLYQGYLESVFTVILLILLRRALEGGSVRSCIRTLLRSLGMLLCAGAVYALLLAAFLKFFGLGISGDYHDPSQLSFAGILRLLPAAWLETFRYVTSSEIAHREASAVIYIILGLISLAEFLLIIRRLKGGAGARILAAALFLLIPLGINCIYPISAGFKYTIMRYSVVFYPMLAILLTECASDGKEAQKPCGEEPAGPPDGSKLRRFALRAVPVLCGVLVFNHILFSNQLYLKKHLEEQAGISFMTRLAEEMEETEGFVPGRTPVLFLGYIDESPLSRERDGFSIYKDYFAGTMHHLSVSYYHTYKWYFENILGYPTGSFLSRDEVEEHLEQYLADPRILEMPVYPGKGSVCMIDGTLVIRLSEDLRPADFR